MKISVIIPYFNKMNNLKYILHNLHNVQKRLPDEIIVVDDDSSNNYFDTLKPMFRFQHVSTDIKKDGKHRAGHARNKGAEIATGDILVFQDGDVILSKYYIDEIYKYFQEHDSIVTGGFEDVDKYVQSLKLNQFYRYIGEKDKWRMNNVRYKSKLAPLVRWLPELVESRQFAIKKKLFWKLKGFDEKFLGWGLEDTEFFWRALYENNQQLYFSHFLYAYHLEHPVDPIYLIDSMRSNAEYFVEKYPEVKTKLARLFKDMGIFYPNPRMTHTYETVKRMREITKDENFGKLEAMKYIGFWRY